MTAHDQLEITIEEYLDDRDALRPLLELAEDSERELDSYLRMRSVERDAFTVATGYPPGIEVEGIPLRDRVWLDSEIGPRPH